jgi:hypothetical protein
VAVEALFWNVTVVALFCSDITGFVLECDGRGFVLQGGSRSSVLECQWKLYFRGLFQSVPICSNPAVQELLFFLRLR